MKVWIVIGGVCYEQAEWVEGVFSSQQKAEEVLSQMKIDHLNYADIIECEVDNPDNQKLVDSR